MSAVLSALKLLTNFIVAMLVIGVFQLMLTIMSSVAKLAAVHSAPTAPMPVAAFYNHPPEAWAAP